MTSTNIFNGVLWVRGTDVKFRYAGDIYIGKCTLADNLDNIVASNFDRCDSSAMPVSISMNESAKAIEITFRVSECGMDAGLTSVLLKKKPRKHIKKVPRDSIAGVENAKEGTVQSTTIDNASGELNTIPSQCLSLAHNIAHCMVANDMQMILLQSLLRENARLRDIINANQSMVTEYLDSINRPIALTQISLSGEKAATNKKRTKH